MSPLEESAVSRYDRTKQRVQDILTGTAFDLVGRVVVISMISLILLNVLAVMAESVAWIRADFARSLEVFETFSRCV